MRPTDELSPVDLDFTNVAGCSYGWRPGEVRPDHDMCAAGRFALKRFVVMNGMADPGRLQSVSGMDCALGPHTPHSHPRPAFQLGCSYTHHPTALTRDGRHIPIPVRGSAQAGPACLHSKSSAYWHHLEDLGSSPGQPLLGQLEDLTSNRNDRGVPSCHQAGLAASRACGLERAWKIVAN